MVKRVKQQDKIIKNKRASFDYSLDDSIVVGIALSGAETKALRFGWGSLQGAYITVKDNQLWLINATITGDKRIKIAEDEQTRTRQLLAKRKEIDELITQKQQGKSIVPIGFLTKGRYIKLRIASGRGKKRYDKRQVLKARDAVRDTNRALKHR